MGHCAVCDLVSKALKLVVELRKEESDMKCKVRAADMMEELAWWVRDTHLDAQEY